MSKLVPDDWWPYYLKAACLLELELSEEAISAASEAILLDSSVAENSHMRALARLENGDGKLALKDAEQAYQLSPEDPQVQQLYKYIRQETGYKISLLPSRIHTRNPTKSKRRQQTGPG